MGRKKDTKSFILDAKSVHGNKYDYSLVNYINSQTNVTIICNLHGEFSQNPTTHTRAKSGCSFCGYITNTIKRQSNSEDFIEKSKIIHGDTYDYSKVEYTNNHTKVTIGCKIHGDFLIKPNHHISYQQVGCRTCGLIKRGNCTKKFLHKFLEEANAVHNFKYDYSKVIYENTDKSVEIICKRHGAFFQKPSNHINQKQGCRLCAYIISANKTKLTLDEFKLRANVKHNYEYDYSSANYTVIVGEVDVICKIHGKFRVIAHSHLRGYGCVLCTTKKSKSKAGTSWLNSLNIKNIIHEHPLIENRKQKVDGYDAETNTVYQFHGTYWHSSPKIYKPNEIHPQKNITHGENYQRTLSSDFQLLCWGYNLIVMWEYDWNDFKKITRKEVI